MWLSLRQHLAWARALVLPVQLLPPRPLVLGRQLLEPHTHRLHRQTVTLRQMMLRWAKRQAQLAQAG